MQRVQPRHGRRNSPVGRHAVLSHSVVSRRLILTIPSDFSSGARCAVGGEIQAPVTIEGIGLEGANCLIHVTCDSDALVDVTGDQTVDLDRQHGRAESVVRLRAKAALAKPSEVQIRATADGLVQLASFTVEIFSSPEIGSDVVRGLRPE